MTDKRQQLTVTFIAAENAVDGVLVLALVTKFVFGSVWTAQKAADGGNRRSSGPVTKAFLDEAISNFPGKYTWILFAVLFNAFLDVRRCNTWL